MLKKITDPENIVPGPSPANSPILDLKINKQNQFSLDLSPELVTRIMNSEQVLAIEVDGDFPGSIKFKSAKGTKSQAECHFKAHHTRVCPITHEHPMLKSLKKSGKLIGLVTPAEGSEKHTTPSMTLQFYHSTKIVIDLDSDLEIDTSGITVLNLLARFPDVIAKTERIRLQFEGSMKNKKSNFLGYGMPFLTSEIQEKDAFRLTRFSNNYIGFIMDQTSKHCDYSKC